jgi:uncharacterized membrane protein
MIPLLAESTTSPSASAPLLTEPAGLLAVLLGILALIFWAAQSSPIKPLFRVIPALIFCYFIPTTLTTFGIIPAESPLYDWVKAYVLPAALFLLILSLDLPGIIRLGPKAGIMLLAGTAGVVVGGPIALRVGNLFLQGDYWGLPPDAWKGLAALSGSWIGGGANFVAIGQIFDASDRMIAMMVVPDVLVANVWMGVLLFCAAHQRRIDRWTGADASAIRALEQRLSDFQARVMRVSTLPDLMIIVALGFGASWISASGAKWLDERSRAYTLDLAKRIEIAQVVIHPGTDEERTVSPEAATPHQLGQAIDRVRDADPNALAGLSATEWARYYGSRFVTETTGRAMWKYVFVTTLGLILSFTRVRNLEGAGASKVGSVMLYLLVACIGAHANFLDIAKAPGYVVVGFIWMGVHVLFLLTVAWFIRAPAFFVAVGSQANIGGAASAPIVAAAYHPSLAPVGVLLAVAGYVLGTYAGVLCGRMLSWVGGGA